MGSRDKRGREKKKPKKQQPKPVSKPSRPAPEYKPPVAPPQPGQTNEGTSSSTHLAQSTATQKVQVGNEVFDAAAVILMKDRDATLERLVRGEPVKASTVMIPFKDKNSRLHLATALQEELELLCIILQDGRTKYCLKNAEHLPIAEQIGTGVDRGALVGLPPSGAIS